jgi:galactose mutarotase-like enzyme
VHELRIGDGSLEAVLLPDAGARLHRLRAFGHDLLRTPSDPAAHLRDPFIWGDYVMAPWCNRIAAGDKAARDRTVRLAPSFPDGSAIHGQVHAIPWSVTGAASCSVRAGGDGWPWPYEVTLSAEALDTSLTLRWRRPIQLKVDAALAYASNVAPMPEPESVADAMDLRTLAAPADGLDGTWTDASLGPVELAWPELEVRATIMAPASARYVAVATPPDMDAIAVEPQTHAPDGLRRLLDGRLDGLAWLPTGESLALDLRILVGRG